MNMPVVNGTATPAPVTNGTATPTLISQLESLIIAEPVDEVFITLPIEKYGHLIEGIVQLCQEQGVVVRVAADLSSWTPARPYIGEINGIPLVSVRTVPRDGWEILFKRLTDIVGSAVLLVSLAPLFAVVALLIKLDSPGPVFFRQERVGLNKRRFQLLKFRTMRKGAEQQQQTLEGLNEADGPVFKIKKDPRITSYGRFLRRFSIDELPQLFNVLKGDMSLVGPRPLPVRDVDRINVRWHKRRFSVKPGITCLWQVNGRSDVSFERWVQMDLQYIDQWSLGLDFKILIKTVPVVLAGNGAY
ncbi:MAG TPA: sugar transferase [Candidatus Saccharimonadales bacterium]|nr:sugar transferase [Candidatus Saccharimonadales bacterium]